MCIRDSLKPCSIESIHELLKNAVDRLNEREEKKEFLQKILDDYHKLENRLEEQAFKDYIINPVTRKESLTEYAPFSSIKAVSYTHLDVYKRQS